MTSANACALLYPAQGEGESTERNRYQQRQANPVARQQQLIRRIRDQRLEVAISSADVLPYRIPTHRMPMRRVGGSDRGAHPPEVNLMRAREARILLCGF